MSHKTRYKTFSQPDLTTLETAVNDHIRSLYKDEKLAGVRVDNITTFSINNIFVAALTYSYGKN
ncbi:MAG: hypothetical protein EOO88_41125 [Pedobacter sp.]|nr:MAG: hypothetical protein EOO88_41125 [Pedobacter sp.]